MFCPFRFDNRIILYYKGEQKYEWIDYKIVFNLRNDVQVGRTLFQQLGLETGINAVVTNGRVSKILDISA